MSGTLFFGGMAGIAVHPVQGKSNFNKKYLLLLMIDEYETNQIVLYFPGGYIRHLKPLFMCRMSCVLCHMPLFNPISKMSQTPVVN